MEFDIKSTAIFTLASERKTDLSINLTKCMQDLHEENYKTDERNQRRSK